MDLIQQNYKDDFEEHSSSSLPSSPCINNTDRAPQLNPRVGHEYQVEVPSIITRSEQLQLLMNPAESEVGNDNTLSFAIGLPIPVTWILNEVENSRHEGDNGKKLKPITFQSVMTGDNNSSQLDKNKKYALVPDTSTKSWSDSDGKTFLLGLYIFGKNFIQIKRFLENKGMGEILAFYHGKFYKSDEYCRWSKCRKMKGIKSVIGEKLFTGRRQHELLSRLIPHVSVESKHTLLKVSKLYSERRVSLEEYVSSLKSVVGLGVLVEAVGIGKEKEDDLTRLALEAGKNNRVFSIWSYLGPSDIIKSLTGLRMSKAKSNDLFWEAVWPRLLARGWHSEQPRNQGYVSSKDYMVFLIPGVKKYSRGKLVKGDHFFDSISDVLSKVVAEPNLLDVEEEAKVDDSNDEVTESGSDEDDQSDDYHNQCYLKPRASTYNADDTKFMVVDTSLGHGENSSELRELKHLPVSSVNKVDVNAGDITHKVTKNMRKVNHKEEMTENIDQKLTDTSILLRESKDSSYDDSPSVVETNKLIHDKKKMVGSLKNQKTFVSIDNQLKKTMKLQFIQKPRSGPSNHAVLPIKGTSTTCAKTETSHIIKNFSGGLESEKMTFSHENVVGDPVTYQKNGGLISSLPEKSVEENNKESILNEIYQCTSVSHDKVQKCESQSSVTFNTPQVPSKSKIGEIIEMVEMMGEDGQCLKVNDPCLSSDNQAVVEEPKTSSDTSSDEQQPNVNSKRQSTRNRWMTLKAMESMTNEFLNGPKRQKRKHIQTHKDAFSACRRARTSGETTLDCHNLDHGPAILVEKKH
ncbi:uncharacterized protein LOC109796434 [Cajanus cajan]|uniref:SANT domain-containing protein n=1 Tax=Cajanus cajan TaxID=3821 RepID=A0A151TVW6_CAJCA|nr:uncharacterized protein LOC109796434 [Cajanus cajan]KYP71219.1 hypothetical protein KK1_010468 [Cajanus cajan]